MTEPWIFGGIVTLNIAVTYLLLISVIRYASEFGIRGVDVNKPDRPQIPEEGGIAVAVGLAVSLSLYRFFLGGDGLPVLVAVLLLSAAVGVVDHFRDLRPVPKVIILAAIGLLFVPLLGIDPSADAWWFLVVVILWSFAFSSLVNSLNLLAGFNGLESGLMVISSLALGLFLFLKGHFDEASVMFIACSGYAVLYRFNRYPSSVFVGNSGTLTGGALLTGIGIISQEWLAVVLVMAPHLLNVVIRTVSTGIASRSDLRPLVYRDGLLELPANSYQSLIRIYLRHGPKHEREIVRYLFTMETGFCGLMFIIL